jgi:hypothetical protein
MRARKNGKTQQVEAGISQRSVCSIDNLQHSNSKGKQRHWRTRQDPIEALWSIELKPMIELEPDLSALTLFSMIKFLNLTGQIFSVTRNYVRFACCFAVENMDVAQRATRFCSGFVNDAIKLENPGKSLFRT